MRRLSIPLALLLTFTGVDAGRAQAPNRVEADAAWWVEGRVRLPPDTPADEEVRVVALGLSAGDPRVTGPGEPERDFFSDGGEPEASVGAAAPVSADGRFRISFPAGSVAGLVWLDAHYLHLDRPVRLARPSRESLVLAPRLGARVTGTFRLPDRLPQGFDIAELEPFPVQVLGWSLTAGRGNTRRTQRVGSDLAFDLGGLPADLHYFLRADPKVFAALADQTLTVEAGRRIERTYLLNPGGRIAGRVLDEKGRPLPGARVAAEPERAGMFFGGFGWRRFVTGPDGRFDLLWLSGSFTVSASAPGYGEARSEELSIGEGGWTDDVVLRPQPLSGASTPGTSGPVPGR